MAYDIFRGPIASMEVPTLKADLNNMIRQFLWTRYEVASRIHAGNVRMVEAELLKKRMEINGY